MSETVQIVGTYAREADGAALLLYSPLFWNDPSYAAKVRRGDFRVLREGDPAWRDDAVSLQPGVAFDTRDFPVTGCSICGCTPDGRYVDVINSHACVDKCHWPYLSPAELEQAETALEEIRRRSDR